MTNINFPCHFQLYTRAFRRYTVSISHFIQGKYSIMVTTSKDTFPDVVTKQTKETESGCNFNLEKLLWTLSQFNSIITEQLPYALLVMSCFVFEKSFLSKKKSNQIEYHSLFVLCEVGVRCILMHHHRHFHICCFSLQLFNWKCGTGILCICVLVLCCIRFSYRIRASLLTMTMINFELIRLL